MFDYDELRINMRQKNDVTFKKILGNLRVGTITEEDTEQLRTPYINLISNNPINRISKLCDYIQSFRAKEYVVIVPTNEICDALNQAMLARNNNEEIELIAQDHVDSAIEYQRKQAYKKLQADNDASMTAGLSRVIKIKKNARVMIRRNIDTSLGFVNGTLCVVDSVIRLVTGEIEKINVKLQSGLIHPIERVKVTFELPAGVYIDRHQFPLILSYAITVHKSQGISSETVVVDAGLYNFAHGQIYVALSRVTTLEGLHLINYDPLSVTADKRAIVRYNDLRERFRPDLLPYALPIHRKRDKKYVEQRWMVPRQILDVQESNDPLDDLANIRGLRADQFSFLQT